MTVTIPYGQPSSRFMRFVRAPVRDAENHPPLVPLCQRAGTMLF